ncbi:MAG: SAM hydrolase/SAM-dependent halogenase family protein [Erysipelotrichaceae bacterium]|jgi:S-adenosylmethionine hydrolase
MFPLILQSDFGRADGAVSAMYGVACSVAPDIRIYDLTHDIPQYDIWEASYRLIQTINYWPEGSVFVSVVDPGVGSERNSLVVKANNDTYVVTPDNGTLTHIKRILGIKEARILDEQINRLPNSGESYTFHGRDIYAYTGARLACGLISFEDIGPLYDVNSIIELPVSKPSIEDGVISGTIDVLDVRYGSLWTNIPRKLFRQLDIRHFDKIEVTISNNTRTVYSNSLIYVRSFADVHIGEPLLYINSLDCVAIAINQGSFANAYNIGTGITWQVELRKIA